MARHAPKLSKRHTRAAGPSQLPEMNSLISILSEALLVTVAKAHFSLGSWHGEGLVDLSIYKLNDHCNHQQSQLEACHG